MIKSIISGFLLIAFTCVFSHVLISQDYEWLVRHLGDGEIAFDARFVGSGDPPQANTDALLDFTFDLVWETEDSITLSEVNDTGGFGIIKTGSEMQIGDTTFQGFSLAIAPSFFEEDWERGQWYEMLRITDLNYDGPDTSRVVSIGPPGFNENSGIPGMNVSTEEFVPLLVGSAILPLNFLSFTVDKFTDYTELNWVTSQEKNVHHFDVERSTNARSWNKIGEVPAKSILQSTQKYTFRDTDLSIENLIGIKTFYYRLNAIDTDKSGRYSTIKSVSYSSGDFPEEFSVFPNPTSSEISVLTELDREDYTYKVYNRSGSLIYENNILDSNISLKDSPSGVYFIKIYDLNKNEKFSKKIIKI